MTMRQIRASDVAPVPWRNGGGLTRELLAWPAAEHWQLRLSVADIACDGPFSAFAGVMRAFVVLEGKGVALDFAHGTQTVSPADAPLRFDGAAAPGCRLLDGPVRDFNLMARSGRWGLLAASPDPWQPPRGSRAGLFTRVGGRWRAGAQTRELSPHTLLFTERAAGRWRFEPHPASTAGATGWWFFHEDEPT